MKTTAAIQLTNEPTLIVDDIELPDPGPGQVSVKLVSSGVCHSQLHQMHNPAIPKPSLFGHEGAGVVTGVGEGVSHVKEGDSAIVTWVRRSPIQGRIPADPTGASYHEIPISTPVYTWSEDVLTSGELVIPIGNQYPLDLVSIIGCAVLTGAGAVMNTAKVRPGESVAVYGAGGVGLCAIQMAAILEAYPIIAVDLLDEKLEFSKKFGATHTINASVENPVEKIIEITGGGADYAMDAIGLKLTNEQILSSTRGGGPGADNHGGMAVLIGMPGNEPMSLDPALFMLHQRIYRGSLGATYPEKDFELFLRWFEKGKFPLDDLVTQRYRLEDINTACSDLEKGEIFGRAIIDYQ